jgi:hypothetical protein
VPDQRATRTDAGSLGVGCSGQARIGLPPLSRMSDVVPPNEIVEPAVCGDGMLVSHDFPCVCRAIWML